MEGMTSHQLDDNGIHHLQRVKSTISIAIFNSYLLVYQRVITINSLLAINNHSFTITSH